jgi:hypothetical protein
MRRSLSTLMLCAGILLAPSAFAGRSCDAEHPPKAITVERGLTLAERTLTALNASGERVVILARAGQDLTKYGLRYSHLGFAYQQPDGQGGQVWRVMHKLNQCGTADAFVYRQGLGEFFVDDLWRYEATWVAPTPEVQERLLALLQDPKNQAHATQLNTKAYNMVAYPWATKYQQSNQWALETLALAMEPSVTSRDRAQSWLKFKGYEPSVLTIRPLTRLGGRATKANVAFDDHPNDKRFQDRIETVTVDSVFDWLQRAQLGKAPVKLAF